MSKKDRVRVLDCRPGSGKTSYAIQYINNLPEDTKVIFITPFLKECERIQRECANKKFYTPTNRNNKGSKLLNFQQLIRDGKNIVSTHSLFSNVDDSIIEDIRGGNYILILDEVMDVVNKINLYDDNASLSKEKQDVLMKEDIKSLLDRKVIRVREDFSVEWIHDDVIFNKYNELRTLSKRRLLYLFGDDLIVWTFPVDVFYDGIFDNIFILTYMFDYQIQAYYYNYFNIEYTKYIVKDMGDRYYEIFPMADYPNFDSEWKQSIKNLVNICDHDKLNKIGSYYLNSERATMKQALCKNWYDRASKESIKTLNNNISNFYKHITKSKSVDRMWTCFKDNKKSFRGNKEIAVKNWIELNTRATNDFSHKKVLVYPINRYLNPFFHRFFLSKNVTISQDEYALSEMIQWIFRSAIRNGEEIWVYIPSQRMRELLIDWLNDV